MSARRGWFAAAQAALLALALAACAGTADPGAAPTAPVSSSPTSSPSAPAPEPTPEPTAERTTFRIATLKGPTTMGLVELMDEAAQGTARHDYQVTVYGTPDEVLPKILQGDVDVALVPANLASVLYAKTGGDGGAKVKVAAINTLGVLQVLEAGDTVHAVADLRGHTILSTGKGASPQYVLEHVLTEAGLDPTKDVTIEYLSEATEVAARLAATPGAVAVLPQPYATVVTKQAEGVRVAIDLTDAWADVTPSRLVTGVVVVRTPFLAEHRAAFDEFLADYRASTQFTNEHPDEAGALIAAAGIVPAAAVATAAIPASHVTYIDGADLRTDLDGYLAVLFAANPASVGGALPGDDFYYTPGG
ncbi:ABC transporter substrate-binding protein [Cellulomonas composti]|uniref:SsuA/THI5-like domain-containing protein n=1 Tax=Cellulomonas composti TaxID=266130 RepID=A0A511J7J4_9CELL|nr:MqnA/MqnD/SBP family protein [Cellulomonas composti]GEL93965.1 hypothetical protein CCO02nite_06230 [Cellulomonas composti]